MSDDGHALALPTVGDDARCFLCEREVLKLKHFVLHVRRTAFISPSDSLHEFAGLPPMHN